MQGQCFVIGCIILLVSVLIGRLISANQKARYLGPLVTLNTIWTLGVNILLVCFQISANIEPTEWYF